MSFFYAVLVPILILGLLYLFIIENNGPLDWIDRISRNSSSLWTYGLITIGLLGILTFLFR